MVIVWPYKIEGHECVKSREHWGCWSIKCRSWGTPEQVFFNWSKKLDLYRIKVQGSEENIKMQLSRKALISQLVGPQIYREKRGCHGEVRIEFWTRRIENTSISMELQFLTCKIMLTILYRISMSEAPRSTAPSLSLIHIWRCRRS